MKGLFSRILALPFFASRSALAALTVKEFKQILRDRQTVSLLIVPPVLQLMLYGFALSPEVEHLRMAVVDLSNSPLSREVVASLVNSHIFDVTQRARDITELSHLVADGKVDVGLAFDPDAQRQAKQGRPVSLQFLIDGVDANTAGIASGFIVQTLNNLNATMSLSGSGREFKLPVSPAVTFAYNPGLIASWFFVPGVMGIVIVIAGTLVSSISVIREKDTGTIEQLLMTPAESSEILAAKIIPLVVLLMGSVLLSLSLAVFVFHVPVRGSLILFLSISVLAVLVAISIGMSLATFSGNQRQAILTSFFINLPLIQLSGALTPVESMPEFFRTLAIFDPLRYYVSALRAILLRGVGLEIIWIDVLALAAFSIGLFMLSSAKFRQQLK